MTGYRTYRVENAAAFETFVINPKVMTKKMFSNRGMPAKRVATFSAHEGTDVPWILEGTRLKIGTAGSLIGSH